jgi:hypothetical protein
MTNVLLLIQVGILTVLLAGFVAVGVVFYRFYRGLIAWVTPVAPGQPSELAKVWEAACAVGSRSVVAQAKTTLMGIQSGASRAEAAIAGDVAEDLAGATPIGALLSSFPTLKRSIRRNPQLLDLALPFLARLGSSVGAGAPVSSGNGIQPKFKL